MEKKKGLTVAFDRQIFVAQAMGGISRYFAELIDELSASSEYGITPKCAFHFHRNRHLEKLYDPSLRNTPLAGLLSTRGGGCHSRRGLLKEAEIVHATFSAGTPYKSRTFRLVSSVFDMTPEILHRSWITNPHLNKEVWLRNSDHIISISKTTANDLLSLYPGFDKPITVIHLGTRIRDVIPRGPLHRLDRFWLFVGKRSGYKNFSLLLKAMARCKVSDSTDLVCAGGGAFSNFELKQISQLDLTERVHHMGDNYLDESLLRWLYGNSECVLVPSAAEGFSLPLIEGLACNTPVVASDIPVHREIGSEFCNFVESGNAEAWAEQLREMMTTRLSTPSALLGPAHDVLMNYYSGSRVAQDHANLYRKLCR